MQSLEDSFSAERETVRNIFERKDPARIQLLRTYSSQFQQNLDSLLRLLADKKPQDLLQTVQRTHHKYEEYIQSQVEELAGNRSYESAMLKLTESRLADSLIQYIHLVDIEIIPSLSIALKDFEQRRENARDSAYPILGVLLLVVIALAPMFANALVKPIIALKAGTERVGEGKYATVKITTTDEVADLTRAFNLMSDKLKELEDARTQLMSEISHEMRTPLQVIKAGCYQVIHSKSGPVLTQAQRDAIAMIHQATNRINTFVNSFLDVAKMEAGLMKFNFAPTDLKEVLTPIIQEAQLIGQTRQITLDFVADDCSPMQLDKDRLSQVFSNLLSNALKYTPDNGAIHVRMKTVSDCPGVNKNGAGCVRIEVQDTGVGIPANDLAKLFEKFYQAQNTPLVKEKGSGLGLALVKHVTEAHGGKASVTSTVGEGSTFTIELPR